MPEPDLETLLALLSAPPPRRDPALGEALVPHLTGPATKKVAGLLVGPLVAAALVYAGYLASTGHAEGAMGMACIAVFFLLALLVPVVLYAGSADRTLRRAVEGGELVPGRVATVVTTSAVSFSIEYERGGRPRRAVFRGRAPAPRIGDKAYVLVLPGEAEALAALVGAQLTASR